MDRLQILHLEDNALDADLIHREFARLGANPGWISATSSDEFHDALSNRQFDAILSDSDVPGIRGLDAMKLVREQRPGMPFIFVSGNTDPQWIEHCLEQGATDYVPKAQMGRLPVALRRLLDAREGERLASLTRSRAVLVDVVKSLSRARSVDAIVDIVRRGARALNLADGATFVLRDGELCHYVDEDAIQPMWKGLRFPMSTCISGWAMLNGQAAVIPDIYADDRIPHDAYRPTFVKSLVMVPIRAEAPIGAIGNYWATPHAATPDEVNLIQALADSTSLAFENVALYESLERRVRERTAELVESNKELEAFSYSVSHDLRAPLRAIQGYGDLLATSPTQPLEGEAKKFVDHIRSSASRMNTLIDDMLSLSKVTRTEVHRHTVPIGAMVRDILNRLRKQSAPREVELRIDDTLKAEADPTLLGLALENLVSNAWKFTGKRDHACIEFFAEPQPDGRTAFCIRDNGAGFDMSGAAQLFEPFRRLHRESEFPGTGVGLAIVRRVMNKHGGDVWVQAAKGEGATFRFVLEPAEHPATLN